jgi:hypothetical protein
LSDATAKAERPPEAQNRIVRPAGSNSGRWYALDGVGVKLQHSARRVYRASDAAVVRALLRLAEVDQKHLATGKFHRDLLGRQVFGVLAGIRNELCGGHVGDLHQSIGSALCSCNMSRHGEASLQTPDTDPRARKYVLCDT